MTTERRRNEETSAPTMHEGVKGSKKVIVDGQPTLERKPLALHPSRERSPLLKDKLPYACQMEIVALAEREEQVPFVSPSSLLPQEKGNRGGAIDLVANGCSYESGRLWQACSLL